jgi:hypothetical protein
MDKHLMYLVKQTERYTNVVAENMKYNGYGEVNGRDQPTLSLISSREPAASFGKETSVYDMSSDDEEYAEEDGAEEEDDETTLIEEETRDPLYQTREAELAILKLDADLSIEDLRSKYARLPTGEEASDNTSECSGADNESDSGEDQRGELSSSDEEYIMQESDCEVDDETTLLEEEAMALVEDSSNELDVLRLEAEMRVEELRARYAPLDDDNDGSDSGDNAGLGDGAGSSSDEEFMINEMDDEVDDETTLIEEEERQPLEEREAELTALKSDAEISIEELRRKYADLPAYDDHSHFEDERTGSSSSDEEYALNDEDDIPDDEASFIEEEARQTTEDRQLEIAALKSDADISIDELRIKYSNMPVYDDDCSDEDSEDSENSENSGDVSDPSVSGQQIMKEPSFQEENYNSSSDEDFALDDEDEEMDDETTLIEEEQRQLLEDPAVEIEILRAEADLSIEELRAKYAEPVDGCDDQGGEVHFGSTRRKKAAEISVTRSNPSDRTTIPSVHAQLVPARRLREMETTARSIDVPRPFLLSKRLTLREYQHKGLSWLVSLHTRRLNGILAE